MSMVLVIWGVCLILGNGNGIYKENDIALFQRSVIVAGLQSRNFISGI